MTRTKWILSIFLLALLIGSGAVLFFENLYIDQGTPVPGGTATIVLPHGHTIYAEVADDFFSKRIGLSGHEGLDDYSGMLFLYEEKALYTYWMKGMSFPIDIIWLDGSVIVGFSENLPTEEPPTTIYAPPLPVDRVLEVQAGFVEKNGLLVGDRLDIQLPTK